MKKDKAQAIPENIEGLRKALFDEINGLRIGTTTLQKATIVHKLATQIIILTSMELENEKILTIKFDGSDAKAISGNSRKS